MSTAVIPANEVSRWDEAAMVRTLKETVCKGATDAQFRMFVEICKSTGLNPLLKEIWFVPGVGIMAARDGYLRVANEHPMFDGMETRVERNDQGVPIKAVCTVWRKDRSHPTVCEAFYDEYKKESSVWKTYKSAMIGKVAEVLTLKRSFSINGVVTEEEIGHQGSQAAADQVASEKIERMKQEKACFDVEVAASRPVPMELTEWFKRLDSDSRQTKPAFEAVRQAMVDKGGEYGLSTYDRIAENFRVKYPKGNMIPSQAVKDCLLDMWECMATFPEWDRTAVLGDLVTPGDTVLPGDEKKEAA